MNRKSAIIVDLDGTLTNCDHRVHFLREHPKDWVSFFEGLIHDEINPWCDQIISAMKKAGHQIILMTGRSRDYEELTIKWLKDHQVHFDLLLMRAERDFRSDSVIKRELYDQYVVGEYEALFVIEDRQSVVAMWRELGLTCLQCAVGDF